MRSLLSFLLGSIALNSYSQNIKLSSNLIIKHGDLTLYLTPDTCTLLSKHVLSYPNFKKIDGNRDDNWFLDTYKSKYDKKYYYKSGYDIGHLTPSNITSYDDVLNHNSFSLFNAAPQKPSFNRGSWLSLEKSIEDSIEKYKKKSIILTGVIYDGSRVNFLNYSRVPIPIYFFKVLYIDKFIYVWIGSNMTGEVEVSDLIKLNHLFKKNNQKLTIN